MRAVEAPSKPFAVTGARLGSSERFTDTGGSGRDATSLSSSESEASMKVHALYRDALRGIGEIRKNYSIVEDAQLVRDVIRDAFERYPHVSDTKIVDMLVFKGRQEIDEILAQWKGRHHVYQYIHSYEEKMLRHEAALKAEEGMAEGNRDEMHDAKHLSMLKTWRERGLIPNEIESWAQYLRWKEEEDNKFQHFAIDAGLFTTDQLEANRKTSQCSVM